MCPIKKMTTSNLTYIFICMCICLLIYPLNTFTLLAPESCLPVLGGCRGNGCSDEMFGVLNTKQHSPSQIPIKSENCKCSDRSHPCPRPAISILTQVPVGVMCVCICVYMWVHVGRCVYLPSSSLHPVCDCFQSSLTPF